MITQKELSLKIKRHFFNSQNNSKNSKFYLTSFAISPGFLILKKLCNEPIGVLRLIKNKIIFFYNISKLSKYELVYNFENSIFDKIYVTWGYSRNFLKDGSYNDNYLNINSKNLKKTLLIVISLDGKKPKIISNNIALFVRENQNYNDVTYLLKIFFKNLKNLIFFQSRKSSWSYSNHFAEIFWKKINESINFENIKKIITLYEAQPFQNYFNFMIKKNYYKTKTVGYVHSTEAFPVHLFKRDGAPDNLMVHGSDQKYHCIKFLNWKKNNVKVIPTLRFKRKNIKKIYNKIILPYEFNNVEFFKDKISFLIKNKTKSKFNGSDIKIHPYKLKSRKHLLLKREIENILKNNKIKKLTKKNLKSEVIVLGTSSTVLEALENNLKVYHVCNDENLQSYSTLFWPNIRKKSVAHGIFEYRLVKKNSCINYKNLKYNPIKYL